MRNSILAGLAVLSLSAAPSVLMAQDDMMADHMAMMEMSAEQSTMYDAWPTDRQAMYDAWPSDLQTYFWTLTPTQQTGWWALNDDQRTRLYAMEPEMRKHAWMSIEKQLTAPPAMAKSTMPAMASNAASTAAPMAKKDYPICSKTIQDSCIQPRAAGKNYGNRPLDYWPGEPASSKKK